MKTKIGFVDTDRVPNYRTAHPGQLEENFAKDESAWQTMLVDFLVVFGALALLRQLLRLVLRIIRGEDLKQETHVSCFF